MALRTLMFIPPEGPEAVDCNCKPEVLPYRACIAFIGVPASVSSSPFTLLTE